MGRLKRWWARLAAWLAERDAGSYHDWRTHQHAHRRRCVRCGLIQDSVFVPVGDEGHGWRKWVDMGHADPEGRPL